MNTPQDRVNDRDGTPQGAGSSRVQGGSTDEFAEKLKTEGKAQVDHYRDVAADEVDRLADSARAAASELEGDERGGRVSQHIEDLAAGMNKLSSGLREKSGDEILRDVKRIARDNPGLFIAGSIAIGFGLSRFAKASSPSRRGDERRDSRAGDRTTGRDEMRTAADREVDIAGVAGNPASSGTATGLGAGAGMGSTDIGSGLGSGTATGSEIGTSGGLGLGSRGGSGSLNDASLGTGGGGTAGAAAGLTPGGGGGSYGTGPDIGGGRSTP